MKLDSKWEIILRQIEQDFSWFSSNMRQNIENDFWTQDRFISKLKDKLESLKKLNLIPNELTREEERFYHYLNITLEPKPYLCSVCNKEIPVNEWFEGCECHPDCAFNWQQATTKIKGEIKRIISITATEGSEIALRDLENMGTEIRIYNIVKNAINAHK